jgi:ribosome-associated toxin RatA of RatAB toxin-antitoxin module
LSHWLGLTVLFLSLSSPGIAAGIDQIKVEARRDGDAVLIEAVARVTADGATAWEVLTAYDRYAQFIPDLTISRVLARAGDTAIVEQKGELGFFLFHFPMEVTFSVSEHPPNAINSRAISGTFRELTGAYVLVEEGEVLRLNYSGRLVPNFRLPPLIGTAAVRSAIQKQFGALVKEIQRLSALRRQRAPQ